MRAKDITAPPCACAECIQAQVTDRPQVRDPRSGELLHGYALKRYWESADAALDLVKRIAAGKVMP